MIRTSRWIQAGLALAIVSPAIYFIAMTQYSAVTHPHWDHVELARFIVAYYDGTLSFWDLFAPHNHTRPFLYRLIYVANAVLTRWDIRSEYIYMIGVGLATWAVHLWIIVRVIAPGRRLHAAVTAAIAGVLLFSPVGHHNHWWSMMLPLTLANLLMVGAIALLAPHAASWKRNVAAAACAWLATYTLTNGLFVFLVAAMVMQASAVPWRKPGRWAVFWILNLILALALYMPGLPKEPATGSRGIIELTGFVVAYIGSPLAHLIYFPFKELFRSSNTLIWAAAIGGVVLLVTADALKSGWAGMRRREPAAMVLYLFVGIGLVSAAATAWGRVAFDAHGIGYSIASRYAIFASFPLFGVLYYYAATGAPGSYLRRGLSLLHLGPRFAACALVVFMGISINSYYRGVHIYREANLLDQQLANAFNPEGVPTADDAIVYPDGPAVQALRDKLKKYKLGPYRFARVLNAKLGSATLANAEAITADRIVTQEFRTTHAGLSVLSFQVVTWGKVPTTYTVAWKLRGKNASGWTDLDRGTLNAGELRDWSNVQLSLAAPTAPEYREFALDFTAQPGGDTAAPIGIPLFVPQATLPKSLLQPVAGAEDKFVMALTARF
ncbi:hypothetical protein [Usitatibacter palustris]|nr:hypothetical protein [Usitatibacter palustris]